MQLRRALPRVFAIAGASLLLLAVPRAVGADETPAAGRVPVVTRLVKLFLEREAAIDSAIRSGDGEALGNLLTDDFEMRTGARPAAPIPRTDWMREMLRTRDPGGGAEAMAVHDYGTVEVVSFAMSGKAGPIAVVDVWRATGADWKLAVRYASPAGTPEFPIPGAGATEPAIPKKY
jgi:hypothetical protein